VPTDLDTLLKLAVLADNEMHKIRLQIEHAIDGGGMLEGLNDKQEDKQE
jgi:hypothetical protein